MDFLDKIEQLPRRIVVRDVQMKVRVRLRKKTHDSRIRPDNDSVWIRQNVVLDRNRLADSKIFIDSNDLAVD